MSAHEHAISRPLVCLAEGAIVVSTALAADFVTNAPETGVYHRAMRSPEPVDSVEIDVLVDNVTDSLSTVPACGWG